MLRKVKTKLNNRIQRFFKKIKYFDYFINNQIENQTEMDFLIEDFLDEPDSNIEKQDKSKYRRTERGSSSPILFPGRGPAGVVRHCYPRSVMFVTVW